jgi:hypothetical protein
VPGGISRAAVFFNSFAKGSMKKMNSSVDQIKIGLAITILSALTGEYWVQPWRNDGQHSIFK